MKNIYGIMLVIVIMLSVTLNVFAFDYGKEELGTRVDYNDVIEYIESDGDKVVDHGVYATVHSDQYNVDFTVLRDGTIMYEHPEYADTDMEYTFHTMWKLQDGSVWMHAYDMSTHLISVTRVY